MIAIAHFENIDQTLSSGYIYTLMLGVIVKIIRILGARHRDDHAARSRVKHRQPRWFAYADEQPVILLVERHRKIHPQARQRLARDLLRLAINYRNLLQVRYVHVNIWP
jgi:hypothetical protein